MTTNEKIFQTVEAFLNQTNSYEWSDLSGHIKEKQLVIKNWLVVRGIMQHLNNELGFHRTRNVSEEKYVRSAK